MDRFKKVKKMIKTLIKNTNYSILYNYKITHFLASEYHCSSEVHMYYVCMFM